LLAEVTLLAILSPLARPDEVRAPSPGGDGCGEKKGQMKKEFIVAVGNSTRYGMPLQRLWWFNGSNNLFSDLKSGA